MVHLHGDLMATTIGAEKADLDSWLSILIRKKDQQTGLCLFWPNHLQYFGALQWERLGRYSA